jgi:arsenate reductase (thioredoxin)
MSSVLEKLNVLLVCTGNTCRSQMAEALLRHKAGGLIEAYSAGSDPGGCVNPFAITVMNELGISMNGHYPKDLSEFESRGVVDIAIFVCSNAAQACPHFSGARERLHWPFEDPAEFVGATDEETLAKYREVRDLIAVRLDEWLADPNGPLEKYRK